MNTYTVTISRVTSQMMEFEVEANNPEDAERLAEQKAVDYDDWDSSPKPDFDIIETIEHKKP